MLTARDGVGARVAGLRRRDYVLSRSRSPSYWPTFTREPGQVISRRLLSKPMDYECENRSNVVNDCGSSAEGRTANRSS
jgi:hypothetical protein